jgi:hypothetical protein
MLLGRIERADRETLRGISQARAYAPTAWERGQSRPASAVQRATQRATQHATQGDTTHYPHGVTSPHDADAAHFRGIAGVAAMSNMPLGRLEQQARRTAEAIAMQEQRLAGMMSFKT